MSNIQKYFPQVAHLKLHKQSYLDNAATTLKPRCVIETLKKFYEEQVSNVHRGDHYLSDLLTLRYENVRNQVKEWIQAKKSEEIIFTKSTTEGINFLAFSLENYFQEGDEILLTEMEHHSNLLPWQRLAKRKKLKIQFLPVSPIGELVLEDLDKVTNKKTKFFSFTYYSNVLGTRNPVKKICLWAKKKKILTLVDGAQAMTAEKVNVQKIDCDFFVFSGHKLFCPTGIGVLYAKKEQFEKMRPYQVGGGMVNDVDKFSSEWAEPPHCFEAGTPPIEGVLAMGSVLNFLNEQDFFGQLKENKNSLASQAEDELKKIEGVKIIGLSPTKKNILSFVLESAHCRDVGQLISQAGVAIRSGHHCCLPLIKKYQLPSGTVRASFSIYNDQEDVKLLVEALKNAKGILS